VEFEARVWRRDSSSVSFFPNEWDIRSDNRTRLVGRPAFLSPLGAGSSSFCLPTTCVPSTSLRAGCGLQSFAASRLSAERCAPLGRTWWTRRFAPRGGRGRPPLHSAGKGWLTRAVEWAEAVAVLAAARFLEDLCLLEVDRAGHSMAGSAVQRSRWNTRGRK
jgi:hypothetical protein